MKRPKYLAPNWRRSMNRTALTILPALALGIAALVTVPAQAE